MNEIENRRSIRKYRPEMPDRCLIDAVLHAAMLAPSAKNRQPWKFIVYTEKAKDKLLDAMQCGLMRMRDDPAIPQEAKTGLTDAFHTLQIMQQAPVLIAVLNTGSGSPFDPITPADRITEICDSLSVGAAVENMLLRAQALGLGTLWIANTFFAYPELTSCIGTDAQLSCAVALGFADEAPPSRPRKPAADVIVYRSEDTRLDQ